MSEPRSQVSNPFSTGAGGPTFEARVQTAFTVHLLTGTYAPCLPTWPIVHLKLQGRHQGYETDDFIATAEDPATGRRARLLAQIKHDVSFTAGDAVLAEVIQAAWNDFRSDGFERGTDAIALITGPLVSANQRTVPPLLEWARFSEDECDFLGRVATARFSSEGKRRKLEALRAQLARANGGREVADRELWDFLRHFHVIGYDLDQERGGTLQSTLSLIAQRSGRPPHLVWSRVLDHIGSLDMNAGVVTVDNLPEDIRTLFDHLGPLDTQRDLQRLAERTEWVLRDIRTDIAGAHVERPELVLDLLTRVGRHPYLLIGGARGTGKSALARELARRWSGSAPVFALRAEQLGKATLDEVLTAMAVTASPDRIAGALSLSPTKYLFLESLEKVLELEVTSAFEELLAFLQKSGGWVVVMTARDYAVPKLLCTGLARYLTAEHVATIPNFTPEELTQLIEAQPGLAEVGRNERLFGLLRNPYLASLAVQAVNRGGELREGDGEREFRQLVWSWVIEGRCRGEDLRRHATFIAIARDRAKRMVYGVPQADYDADAVVGLEGDGVLRQERGLVYPAHDVLEDWAIEEFIDLEYRRSLQADVAFLEAVGSEPAMVRAFRLWLQRALREEADFPTVLLSFLREPAVPDHWQDEVLATVLLSDHPADFLDALQSDLMANGARLLDRLCFTLRVVAQTPSEVGGNERLTSLRPYGQGWQDVIAFLQGRPDALPEALLPNVVALLEQFARAIPLSGDPPGGSREAGLLALRLLRVRRTDHRRSPLTETLIRVVLRTAVATPDEFRHFLQEDILTEGRDRAGYANTFEDIALRGLEGAFFAKSHPDDLIALARWTWTDHDEDDDARLRFAPYGRRDIDDIFGLGGTRHDYGLVSGAKGPFVWLLRFHFWKGLNFILELCNEGVRRYAEFLDGTPEQDRHHDMWEVEIPLRDGSTRQVYASPDLWSAYRDLGNLPGVVKCALIALENQLIEFSEQARGTEVREQLRHVFDHILRHSDSVAPFAVLGSLATGFPGLYGEVALPILSVLEFYQFDLSRRTQDSSNTSRLSGTAFPGDELSFLLADERNRSNARPWRKEGLEDLIVRLQFSELQEQAFAAVDAVKRASRGTVRERFLLHRIDVRECKFEAGPEPGTVLVRGGPLPEDLKRLQQENGETNRRFGELWAAGEPGRAGKHGEATEGEASEHKAFERARAALESLSTPEEAFMHRTHLLESIASLFQRRHLELSPDDLRWTQELFQQELSEVGDEDDIQGDAHGYPEDRRLIAEVFPLFLRHARTPEERSRVVAQLVSALTHPSGAVREGAANGIRRYLWVDDPPLARQLMNGALEYAHFQQNSLERRWRLRQQELSVAERGGLAEQLRQDLATFRRNFLAAPPPGDLDAVDFTTHSPWFMLPPCLMVPDRSVDPLHIGLYRRMLMLLGEDDGLRRRHSEADQEKFPHEDRTKFEQRFAAFLATVPEGHRVFGDTLRQVCLTSPHLLRWLLTWLFTASEKAGSMEEYWRIWEGLAPTVQRLAREHDPESYGRRDQAVHELLREFMHAGTDWNLNVARETRPLRSGKAAILRFVAETGGHPDVLEGLASLIYTFSEDFFLDGVQVLAPHVRQEDSHYRLTANATFYIETAVARYLGEHSGRIPKAAYGACLALLTAAKRTGSARAFYLRERLLRHHRAA